MKPFFRMLIGGFLGGVIGSIGMLLVLYAIFGNSLDQGVFIVVLTGPLGILFGVLLGSDQKSLSRTQIIGGGIGFFVGILVMLLSPQLPYNMPLSSLFAFGVLYSVVDYLLGILTLLYPIIGAIIGAYIAKQIERRKK